MFKWLVTLVTTLKRHSGPILVGKVAMEVAIVAVSK